MIELKYFQQSDFNQLISWFNTPDFLFQWGGPNFNFPLTEQQLEDYLRDANKEHSNVLIYSVFDKELERVVGHISLKNIDRKNRSARVAKVIVGDENARGKGIGQNMLTEILKVAFNELKLHRVSLGVFDFNTSAIACYEKVGFTKEGLQRDNFKNGDEYWSLVEMSILEDEWNGR
ncbi:GNAT family N-acetyltransferase [Paraliobacillus salinarum]|uniref:GNAT family N-acetyltransferase n=1 Tax=Paraliobacillus salinarum TaxID=1158996 RepID=UPI0015F460E9|nr:GNAT family protein [Paraliobacillus salinarum]